MSETAAKKRVLIADDDASIRRLVEMMLARHGLTVITARDGEEALQKVATEKPDAILLDIAMPKLDGLQVCAKLKSDPVTANIPVGFLTAKKDVGSYKQGQKLGGILYITKPFKPEKLIDVVGLLLSAGGQSPKL